MIKEKIKKDTSERIRKKLYFCWQVLKSPVFKTGDFLLYQKVREGIYDNVSFASICERV